MNIGDQQKLLAEEAKRRRAAALEDYERRQAQRASMPFVDYPSTAFHDTPAQAADTACSVSDSSGSCGGGE